jgi:DNA-directed RNA polymerase subunit L
VDDELAKIERKKYLETPTNDERQFDNFEILKCYSRDAHGRPDWIDFSLESVGVMSAKDIFRVGLGILRRKVDEYIKEASENIKRTGAEYEINIEQGGHTVGALVQAVIYADLNVSFVSYDIPHPLKNDMKIRFALANEGSVPEKIIRSAKETIDNYCSIVEKVL